MTKQPYHAFDGRDPFADIEVSGDGGDMLIFAALLIGILALALIL